MKKIYAGIGARSTPEKYLELMEHVSHELSPSWMLRSGGALGADSAFERGALDKEIHLPWNSYNNHWDGQDGAIVPEIIPAVAAIAEQYHPNWRALTGGAKAMMYRNVTVILGVRLDSHVNMVVCWTKDGKLVGGTSQAMRIAYAYDIPVYNLALESDITRLAKIMNKLR
jgi:hypothetical protein